MGHVTRCVPLIRQLLNQENKVIFSGNDSQLTFVEREFRGIETEILAGYQVTLDSRRNTYVQIIEQALKLRGAIQKEKNWLAEFVQNNNVDVVISDNRYGFHHEGVFNVFITHQLNLQLPAFGKSTSGIIQNMINKFDVCWVPDSENHSLSGNLSKGNLSIPIEFIGPLCRFKKQDEAEVYEYLVILSGPEPERSNFANDVLDAFKGKKNRVAFVGADLRDYPSFLNPSTSELEELIAQSEIIVSRAGYTTIMEMTSLNKKAILVPTKGQFEQLYLASYLKIPGIVFKSIEIFKEKL